MSVQAAFCVCEIEDFEVGYRFRMENRGTQRGSQTDGLAKILRNFANNSALRVLPNTQIV